MRCSCAGLEGVSRGFPFDQEFAEGTCKAESQGCPGGLSRPLGPLLPETSPRPHRKTPAWDPHASGRAAVLGLGRDGLGRLRAHVRCLDAVLGASLSSGLGRIGVSCGYRNKLLQTGGLRQQAFTLPVPEGRSPESRCAQGCARSGGCKEGLSSSGGSWHS